MIKGVLVDIDGTLIDSNDAHAKAWVDAFTEYNYDIAYDKIRPLIGMGGDQLLKKLIPSIDNKEGEGKKITETRKKIFLEKYVKELKPTSGARDFIEILVKNNIRIIVATSASDDELHTLLQSAHVDDLIQEYTTASDVEKSKPAPDIIAVALKKINLTANEVIMVGDTPYDIEAAEKCNVKTIAVRSGGFSDEVLKGAALICDDPYELIHRYSYLFI